MTSRISTLPVESATGETAELFTQIKKAAGSVPNTYAAIGALLPAGLKSILAAETVLASGSLGRKDLEAIKLATSRAVGCEYCVAAHSLLGKMAGLSQADLEHIRAGEPTGNVKRDALVRFVHHLQAHTGTVDKEEFAAIKAAGYTDVQLVEISLAIALTSFTNTFNRINDTTIDFPAVGTLAAA
ncbi:carboxymuconolactone decarboxylase family protein [Neorhizobium sp. Rsf11]|uniref:Carboxymuconolactone decarboxylase family protein n=2 Tax=Neorhizobium TaxID=1525371 RepID=A0ABV0MBY4_9HYPH|nr:carboxymuconolactone decarboxylase family protein [Neorhizobium petrolearium]MCC2613719.1 carboxymuconolactone decarboxylase family protein [Neorhizobium petrolearium]WGI72031.1 carboxymuconolactone decarboxylase family protein [Neorhizobium petrolearium]